MSNPNTDKPKLLKGYFKYQLKDAVTGEVIQEHEDNNKVMDNISYMVYYMCIAQKGTITADDFQVSALVLGDKGLKNGIPRTLNGNEESTFAETDPAGYAYAALWDPLAQQGAVTKTSEGEKGHFDGAPIQGTGGTLAPAENGLHVAVEYSKNVHDINLFGRLKIQIELRKFSGNTHDFSEAGLYMRWNTDAAKDKPGTLLSMKTFPKVTKTDACVLTMEWELDFRN